MSPAERKDETEERSWPTLTVLNKHTAPLHLPHAVHYDGPGMSGITLAPGLNTVPAAYLSELSDNPTVESWLRSGLIEVQHEDMDAEPEKQAETNPEVKP